MISRWKAALISSVAFASLLPASPLAGVIRSVSISGARAITLSVLQGNSLLRAGLAYSDSLVSLEVARVDSVYFSRGYLGVDIQSDTSMSGEDIEVRLTVSEGEAARIGKVSVNGAESIGEAEAMRRVRPAAGDRFDPFLLEESLKELLGLYNESGFPYAQVWLTGFDYRAGASEVDITISISEGEHSAIARVVFDGLAKTDSSLALRASRIKPGVTFSERRIERARSYLEGAGLFQSVGEARLERRSSGRVDLVIPVKEIERGNSLQGALGFSRKEQGEYVLNGSVSVGLNNVAGTGRNVRFDWVNDGEDYSRLALKYRQPFLFSSPMSLDGELEQVIQDSIYSWITGGLYLGVPLGPYTSIVAGAGADRNVPDSGELIRSVRERFRLGLRAEVPSRAAVAAHVEGAYRKRYLRSGAAERDGEFLYRVDGVVAAPTWGNQSVHVRLVSEAVFSSGDIPLAELFPLGGATTLRGYREGQFRGERIACVNVEYRFGAEGWLFLFDDVGAFYRSDEGWTVKNGSGFGLRSQSPLGAVVLSFGVGETLSLEGTRIHIALVQKF